MTTDLRLAVFAGSGTEIVTLDELLASDRRDVSLDAGCISLVVDGIEQWGPRLSFGPIGFLVRQLDEAHRRVAAGRRALLRGGGFDTPVSELVVFDPHRSALVASVVATDAELGQGPPDDGMYAFVDAHLDEMQAAGQELRELKPVTVDTAAIVTALAREAQTGAEVIARFKRRAAGRPAES